ncbi:MAG: hypothetical protein M3526_05760 [Actinomycetota bacterium]|nr:hypothetical protein [Actinomycetota bacterium]MDQ5874871.1 hypothetical protein [Actinomycetota bacterium]
MQPVAVVTLVGVALTVLVLAVYLVTVAWILRHVSFTLGTVIAGLRAIANQTEPLDEVITEMDKDLEDVKLALEALVAKAGQKTA